MSKSAQSGPAGPHLVNDFFSEGRESRSATVIDHLSYRRVKYCSPADLETCLNEVFQVDSCRESCGLSYPPCSFSFLHLSEALFFAPKCQRSSNPSSITGNHPRGGGSGRVGGFWQRLKPLGTASCLSSRDSFSPNTIPAFKAAFYRPQRH